MKSLPEFASELGCTPQALHKAKKRIESTGIVINGVVSNSDKRKILYSEEQLELIKNHLNIVEKSSNNIDLNPKIEVIEGNHSQDSTLAKLPNQFNLENFRTDSVRLKLSDNPTEYVQNLTIVLSAIESYMDLTEQKQLEELKKIQQTNNLAKSKLEQFKDRKFQHQLKTEVIGQLQNLAIEDFQNTAKSVEALGLGK